MDSHQSLHRACQQQPGIDGVMCCRQSCKLATKFQDHHHLTLFNYIIVLLKLISCVTNLKIWALNPMKTQISLGLPCLISLHRAPIHYIQCVCRSFLSFLNETEKIKCQFLIDIAKILQKRLQSLPCGFIT